MIKSPCINTCDIDKKRDLCIGCYRTSEEITKWSIYNDLQKKKILQIVKKRFRSKNY